MRYLLLDNTARIATGGIAGAVTMIVSDDIIASILVGLAIGLGAGAFNVMMSVREGTFKLNIAITDMLGSAIIGVMVYVLIWEEFTTRMSAAISFVAALLAFNIIPVIKSRGMIEGAVTKLTGIKPSGKGKDHEEK